MTVDIGTSDTDDKSSFPEILVKAVRRTRTREACENTKDASLREAFKMSFSVPPMYG